MKNSDNNSSPSPEEAALDKAIAALPRNQLPTRDLWPELQAQLPKRPAKRGRLVWAAAAVLAALYLSNSLLLDLAPDPATAPPVAQVDAETAEASLLNVYETQKAAQLAELNLTSPAINRQLEIWDGAVQQVRGAMRYYPDEPQLLQQLDRLYRQQLDYLETLAMHEPQLAALYY